MIAIILAIALVPLPLPIPVDYTLPPDLSSGPVHTSDVCIMDYESRELRCGEGMEEYPYALWIL
jgi:hypothetical protein